ncbi:hypothetical protein F7725_005346, partial [Dissostichus mawsoni]
MPTSSNVRWNFHIRAINTVFEHKADLIHCFESIRDSGNFDPSTVREAAGFVRLLEDQDFKFLLQLFHHIMPHVDFLYAKLQKKNIDSVCDTILGHTRERFSFTNHLVSATLLQGDRFEEYKMAFPEDALRKTLKAYPMLNGSKLKTELSLIYSKEEFKACRGAMDLFQLFMENNLEEVFSE